MSSDIASRSNPHSDTNIPHANSSTISPMNHTLKTEEEKQFIEKVTPTHKAATSRDSAASTAPLDDPQVLQIARLLSLMLQKNPSLLRGGAINTSSTFTSKNDSLEDLFMEASISENIAMIQSVISEVGIFDPSKEYSIIWLRRFERICDSLDPRVALFKVRILTHCALKQNWACQNALYELSHDQWDEAKRIFVASFPDGGSMFKNLLTHLQRTWSRQEIIDDPSILQTHLKILSDAGANLNDPIHMRYLCARLPNPDSLIAALEENQVSVDQTLVANWLNPKQSLPVDSLEKMTRIMNRDC